MQMTPRGKRIFYTLVWVWGANFLAFFVISFLLGGDAWSGKVEQDLYFLAARGHFIEVTPVL